MQLDLSSRLSRAAPRMCLALALAVLLVARVAAMRIVLTNDDGFEHRNIQTLFNALKAAGHEVILSAPYQDESGTSAMVGTFASLPKTAASSPAGRVASGAPGVGPTTIAADQYYVDSSPAGAVLYGIDVAAAAKWNAAPDLVIAGPNDGNNLGAVTPHSGTIGATVTALNRGIPAIAVSAAPQTPSAALPLLGEIIVRLVSALEQQGRVRLPPGIGLNVNLPPLDPQRSASSYGFAFTQVGSAASAATASEGSETAVFNTGNFVTVSPLQSTYQAPADQAALVLAELRDTFTSVPALPNPKLLNLSVRGLVGIGNAVQVAGFFVAGVAPKTFLIRAAGPALAAFGVSGALGDPVLEVMNASGQLVASNDDWSEDAGKSADIAAAVAKVGAFAWERGSRDAALVVKLPPGAFTAVVRGAGDTTGIALIEIYDLSVD